MSHWGMLFPGDESEAIRAGKEDFLVRMFFEVRSNPDLEQKD